MTPIETLALIFAIWVLLKLVIIMAVDPKKWWKLTDTVVQNTTMWSVVLIILGAIVAYYLLMELTIVQISAVLLFGGILFRLSLMPYSKGFLRLKKEFTTDVFAKNWITVLILIALALWTLYALFA